MWMKLILWAILLGSVVMGYLGYQTGSATMAAVGIGIFILGGFILFFFIKAFIHFGFFVVKIILVGVLIGIAVLGCLKGCQILLSPGKTSTPTIPATQEENIPTVQSFAPDSSQTSLWQKTKGLFSFSKSAPEEPATVQSYVPKTVSKKLPTAFSGKVVEIRSGYLFKVGSHFVKLYGIDAPDPQQTCLDKNGASYDCGQKSKMMLSRLITGETVSCQIAGGDYRKNYIATCKIQNIDIGASMITAGWAIADRGTTSVYTPYEEDAHRNKRGLWAGKFVAPAKARVKHAQQVAQQQQPVREKGFWDKLF